jgi:hypothetical protein
MADRVNYRILLLKLFFPLIYAGFFVVQLFINFDTALIRFSDRYQVIHCRNQANYPVAFKKEKESQPIITKFRLNRNFEPAVFITPAGILCTPAVHFITVQHIRYANPFIAEPLRYTCLFRGPPYFA